jgi:ABC-type multidrug transport system fused ATPase/permease subunit
MSSSSVSSALKKLRFLLTKEDKLKWLGIVGFSLISSLFEIITAALIVIFAQSLNQPNEGMYYLQKLGVHENLSHGRMIFYISLAVGAVYLFKNIIASIEVFYQNFTIQKMNYLFKNKLLYKYAEADYAQYLNRNSSLGFAVVGGDCEQMFSSGMLAIAVMISESLVFFSLIAMIIYMNPSLALIIGIVGAILGIATTKFLMPKFYKWGQRLQNNSLLSNQNLMQFFHGFKEIVLLGKRDSFINAYQFYSKQKSLVQALQTASNNLPRLVIETLFIGVFVITIAILCFDNESPAQIVGILGGYLYAGFRLMPGLNRIINQINVFKGIIPSIERVYSEYTNVSAKESYEDIQNFTFNNSVTLKDVSFKYPNSKTDALDKISLTIKKGECLGIVGETGSGKSTLVDVILGLLKPFQGNVLVDNKYNVCSYQWHSMIGYVPQAIYLTDDTIEANIAFGETDIDCDRLNLAINAAQLVKFVQNLPDGVKTIVGERGIRLSGGERQRISIARALYRNPEVLIFDEATSALDNETETKLMETINKVSKNRTVIMIAHRLTTLKSCDSIIAMEKGRIASIAKYEDLVKG